MICDLVPMRYSVCNDVCLRGDDDVNGNGAYGAARRCANGDDDDDPGDNALYGVCARCARLCCWIMR